MYNGHHTPDRPFPAGALRLDTAAEATRIERFIATAVSRRLRRRGVVLGVSGGVDSAVCATLAARALGPQRVLALLMPERHSSEEATERALRLCRDLGVRHVVEDITESLEALGCYHRAEEYIRQVFPDYGSGWRHKIVIGSGAEIPFFNLVVQSPDGIRQTARMPPGVYLGVVAATNFKQRVRKNLEYFHAEAANYAVLGTPNLLEYALGFFVRGGDGLADLKPIAHLYKSQVYDLAEYLGVPEEIRSQPPSTDTYGLAQTQEEFYFALPYGTADLLLFADRNGISAEDAGAAVGLDAEQVRRCWRDFMGKRLVAERNLGEALRVDGPLAERGAGGPATVTR